jgi:hypothetical protein
MEAEHCSKCGERKSLDQYYRAAGTRDGHRSECKACNAAASAARYKRDPQATIDRVTRWQLENPERLRQYRKAYRQRPEVKAKDRAGHLRRTFGISSEEYDELLDAQDGGCAICGKAPRAGSSLHVDHDHGTGRVRALLCFDCNAGLGKFGDDHRRLQAAIGYLLDHRLGDLIAEHASQR